MSSDQTSDPQVCNDQTVDPSQVAKYPVYHLFYQDLTHDTGADGGAGAVDRASRVELDRVRVEPAPGQSPREAAIAAIAKKAKDHQRDAVRVVVTNAENERWKMIVTAQGATIDLSDEHSAETKTTGKKKPLLVAGGGVLVVVVAASVTAAVLITDSPDDETVGTEGSGTGAEAPAAWEAPDAGAQVPVGLPDDYSTTATWVTPITEGSGVMELSNDKLSSDTLSNDTLAMIGPEGNLQAIDAQTAQPQWYSTEAPEEMADVHQSTWAGEPVIAEVTSSQLRIWPIPTDSTPQPAPATEPVQPHSVEPHTVELAHQADVTFIGDSPLIDLGDYVVAADAGDGTLTEVGIPAGADPLLVSDGEVVSIDDTHLYHSPINTDNNQQSADQESADQPSDDEDSDSQNSDSTAQGSDGQGSKSTELAHHSAVRDDRPQSVWPLTAEVVAGLYEGEDEAPIMQVFNTEGERITSSYLDSTPTDQDSALVDPEADTAVIGNVAISWGDAVENTEPESTDPEISDLTPPREPLLHGSMLWGEATDGPARVDITDLQAEPQAYEAFSDEDPPPVLVTDEAAYVEAPRVDQTLLYRAEHQQRAEHQHPTKHQPPGGTGSPTSDHEEDDEDDEEQEEGS